MSLVLRGLMLVAVVVAAAFWVVWPVVDACVRAERIFRTPPSGMR